MKYQVGDKLKVLEPNPCRNYTGHNGAYIIITKVYKDSGFYRYDIYDESGNKKGLCCACLKDEHLAPYDEPKTMHNLAVGDVVVDEDGEEYNGLSECKNCGLERPEAQRTALLERVEREVVGEDTPRKIHYFDKVEQVNVYYNDDVDSVRVVENKLKKHQRQALNRLKSNSGEGE